MRVFLSFILVLFWTGTAAAWQPHIQADPRAPERLFVVDKQEQSFFVFRNKSRLQKEHVWRCSTGQAAGDKKVEGDLKTPEGVYFMERTVMTSYIDYEQYGELALTLNYPNPVDRIKAKTGFGIWVHGRGRELVPFDSEGCVVMDKQHIRELEQMVELQNTPLIITSAFTWSPEKTMDHFHEKIAGLTGEWARAFARGSEDYFDFYDPDLLAISTDESFRVFRKNREEIFERCSLMDVYISRPEVLTGPDYWVSYFRKIFSSCCTYTQGIKRLYWQKDEQGRMRIVGEEYRSCSDQSLRAEYEQAGRR